MNEAHFFTRRLVTSGNPLRLHARARLVVGLVYVVTSTIVLAAWMPEMRILIASPAQLFAESTEALRGAARALLAVGLFGAGVAMLARSVGGLTRLVVPPRAPRDLEAAELISALSRRELPAYSESGGKRHWLLSQWLPHQIPVLTQRARALVADGFAEITRAFWILAVVLLAVGAFGILPPEALLVLGPYRTSVPIWFLVTYVAGVAVYVAVVVRARPRTSPRIEVQEFRASIRGGGDPVHIPHGLEQELGFLRPADGPPNRSTQLGFSMYEGGVTDAGLFDGQLLVENQPQIVVHEAPHPLRMLVLVGAVLQLVALYWFYSVPSLATLETLTPAAGAMLSVYWVAQIGGAVLLLRLGGRMNAAAAVESGTFRFRSTAVLLSVKGNFARTQVRVGRGLLDSIESENHVVRSDCTVAGYTAAVLTESRGLLGDRRIVGMVVDDEARTVEQRIAGWLREFEARGAAITGVDLTSPALADVVHANLGVERQRPSGRVRGAELARLIGASGSTPLLAASPGDMVADVTAGDPVAPGVAGKVCPDCAEPVRAAAHKCRYCGFRFDERTDEPQAAPVE